MRATHLFYCTWLRQDTEDRNIEVNGAMTRNTLDAAGAVGTLEHVALVTGLKHYLGPFEAYAQNPAKPPFRESQPRLDYKNFYYDQEDILFAAADKYGFRWSVHRPHTVIGYALGNAMNMGVTLAVYGTIARETGRPFVFPGSPEQYDGTTDITDARLLARHLTWAATSPAGANEAFNVVNGDTFHWRQMWEVVAVGPRRRAGAVPGSPDAAGRADGRRARRLAGDRRAVRAGRARRGPAGPVVAHRQRPGSHGRDLRGHVQEPAGRLLRRPGQPPVVPGPVRPAPSRAGHPRIAITEGCEALVNIWPAMYSHTTQ